MRRRMLEVYRSADVPAYLDAEARDLLHEGREAFRRFDLESRSLVQWREERLLFPWAGDREMHTMLLQLLSEDLASSREGVALLVQGMGPSEILDHIAALHQAGPADAEALARRVANKRKAKHHRLLGEELLVADYASSDLSPEGAYRALDRLPELTT